MPTRAPVFRASGQASASEREREHDQRRGSARARGYDRKWDAFSASRLKAHPWCVGCQARGVTTLACVTDHIIPPKGDCALFWKPGNWQSVCTWCHSVVKQVLERMLGQGMIDSDALRLDHPKAIEVARRLAR